LTVLLDIQSGIEALMDNVIIISIDADSSSDKIVLEAEAFLKNIKIRQVHSEREASNLLQSIHVSDAIVAFIIHDLDGYNVSEKLLNDYPDLRKIFLVRNMAIEKLPDKIDNEKILIFPFPGSGNDLALLLNQILKLEKDIKKSSDSIESVTQAANAFMRSHQDLATLVHCGQEIQGDISLEDACERIISSLKDIELDTDITFAKNAEETDLYRKLANDSARHFEVKADKAILYFSKGHYSGLISLKTLNGVHFDIERFGDLIHLIKNQLTAFLERLISIEEREKLYAGYKAILDQLEDMIMSSEISKKAYNVQKELENDTENIFQLLDKIREKAPDDIAPWLDEVEIKLQFADKVSQQINSLAGILRELLSVLNPEMADELKVKNQESANSILQSSADTKQDVEDLLASLGM
jgi:hypothetical protein